MADALGPTGPIKDCLQLLDRFLAYRKRNPSWGPLHVCFANGNWRLAQGCLERALNDPQSKIEDLLICELACRLTATQRKKLANLVEEAIRQGR